MYIGPRCWQTAKIQWVHQVKSKQRIAMDLTEEFGGFWVEIHNDHIARIAFVLSLNECIDKCNSWLHHAHENYTSQRVFNDSFFKKYNQVKLRGNYTVQLIINDQILSIPGYFALVQQQYWQQDDDILRTFSFSGYI